MKKFISGETGTTFDKEDDILRKAIGRNSSS